MQIKPKGRVLATAAFVVASCATFSQAAEAETKPAAETKDVVPLEEIVVTATRAATPIDKTASSITVITREEIADNQYRNLASAIRTVPSMTIADRGTPGSVTGIFLRGSKSEHTSILIDGRPIPVNLAGTFNIETITLENIERIEVLRGPASSLYGGKTIGGAINLITRTGKGLDKPEVSVLFEGGSHNTFREELSIRGAHGIADYSFEISRFDTTGERINSDYDLTSAAGHFGLQITPELYFETDLRMYSANGGVPGSVSFPDPDDFLETDYISVAPRLTWQTTDIWKQSLAYTYSHFDQEASNFSFAGQNNEIEVETSFLEYQSEIRVVEPLLLTFGGTFQDRNFTRFDKDSLFYDVDAQETNWALFAEGQLEIVKDLNVIAGVRYDDYSEFGEATTWRTGISYRVPVARTLIHANYGTAFSPPSPQDVQPALYGNPFLVDPEESKGWEVGIEQPFWGDKGSVFVTYFENKIDHLIEYDPNLYQITQVDEARLRGIEVGFKIDPVKEFQFNANYTYLDADNVTDDVRLVRRPRHQINGGVAWLPIDTVRLGLTANYVIDREDGFGAAQADFEDYLNLRLTASWKITKNVEIFGRIDNLLDDEYQEVQGFPSYGRTFYAGIKLTF